VFRRRAVFALPPNISVVSKRDVGVKRVVRNRFHRVRIRFVIGSRYNAEIPVLRIDRVQPTIANLKPADVVTNRGHFPTGEMLRRNQHGEIRFAARARERRRHVMLFPVGRFDTEN